MSVYNIYSDYLPTDIEWLPSIPGSWSVKPLKFVVSCNDDAISESTPDDMPIRYVDISSVNYRHGITKAEGMLFKDAPSRARRRSKSGDVVISTVRTYLKAVAAVDDNYADCIYSTGFAVLRANSSQIEPKFLKWLVLNELFIQAVEAHSEGLSYPAINASELLGLKTPVPTIEEQGTISKFLERETVCIDNLIAKKEQFIELLKEKRAAIITHAVINSNVAGHYVRLDRLFQEIDDPVSLEDMELLTPSVIHGVVPQSALGARPQQALREGYMANRAQPNDFIISMSSHAHGIEYCGINGGISPDYTLLRPKCDLRIIPYLRYALKSDFIIRQLGMFKTGIRMGLRLQWNKVRYCKIPVPTPENSLIIAKQLDNETGQIGALVAKTEKSIELLREKRSALITAAVTGKIDVRNAA